MTYYAFVCENPGGELFLGGLKPGKDILPNLTFPPEVEWRKVGKSGRPEVSLALRQLPVERHIAHYSSWLIVLFDVISVRAAHDVFLHDLQRQEAERARNADAGDVKSSTIRYKPETLRAIRPPYWNTAITLEDPPTDVPTAPTTSPPAIKEARTSNAMKLAAWAHHGRRDNGPHS